ncbi:hypothetical protein [Neopusillimonas maritima]|uniref:Uncharacterized protein n=1 Tax=Neopusillimonas maritima TaxID=2026239 RepID=A0A3A1YYT6_9BURK|nr:hypothetical protein [Neopusillimonas maritima]RIY41970.1 hypothetical protein CJP73_00550 [Neopusillimonas maritima]
MNQEALFYDSFADALKEVVKSAGGSKAVGCKLWPEKTPDAAHRTLLDCLNESRSEKFSPEQVLLLIKIGREVGCHAGINYLSRETGYSDPTPIEPEDERARLQREFIEAQKAMSKLAERMERVGMIRAVA